MTSSKSSSKSPSVVGEKVGGLAGKKISGLAGDRIGEFLEIELQSNHASDAYSLPLHTLAYFTLNPIVHLRNTGMHIGELIRSTDDTPREDANLQVRFIVVILDD